MELMEPLASWNNRFPTPVMDPRVTELETHPAVSSIFQLHVFEIPQN